MDFFRFSFIFSLCFLAAGCGNRFDLATERGKQARIDETNFYLSIGDCGSALAAIAPVYASFPTEPDVLILRASVDACNAGFELVNLLINIAEKDNPYTGLAKAMPTTLNDGKLNALYSAVDVLTEGGTKILAGQRDTRVNTFMVFLQLGLVGSVLSSYGSPDSEGNQGANLDYQLAQAGTMTDLDACALAAAHSIALDSFNNSNLTENEEARKAANSLDARCVAIGKSSCTEIEKDRSVCDGANAASTDAVALVGAINAFW